MASAVENDHEFQKPSQPFNAESHPPAATDVSGMPPNLGEAGSGGLPQPEAPLPARFQANPGAGDWSTDLCDCFDDVPNCCLTFWCPCIAFGQLSEIVDRGTSSCALNGMLYFLIAYLVGCPCLYSCFYRSKLRQQYQLSERPCNDCLVHFFCESCSLCQEYRELKHRGFNVSIGWHANAEKRNGGITMAPIVPEHMSR